MLGVNIDPTVVCLFLATYRLLAVSDAALQPDYAAPLQKTEAFMTQLADARVLSGALLVSKAGNTVHSKG